MPEKLLRTLESISHPTNYTFENKQNDIEYANWNKEYAEYRSYMLKKKIYIEVDSDDVQEPGNAGEGE